MVTTVTLTAADPPKAGHNWRAEMQARIDAAVAAGTHSLGPPTVVCQQCGADVVGGYFDKTQDGRMLGPCCAAKSELDRVEGIQRLHAAWRLRTGR